MDTETALQTAKEILQPWARSITSPEDNRMVISISRIDLKAGIKALLDAHWGYLSCILGVDFPGNPAPQPEEKMWQRLNESEYISPSRPEGKIRVQYIFFSGAACVTLRVAPHYSNLWVPSICDLIPSATLMERELMEMFGVRVEGTPDTTHLLLPDQWPDGEYPLRKWWKGLDQELPQSEEVD
jgi:NADH:ubiquinone oxidoreductase subunit C